MTSLFVLFVAAVKQIFCAFVAAQTDCCGLIEVKGEADTLIFLCTARS